MRDIPEGDDTSAGDDRVYVPDLPKPVAGEDYDPETQRLERAEPTLEGYGWRIVDLTAEEIEARNAPPERVTRRQLLLVLAGMPDPVTTDAIEAMIGDDTMGLIEFRNAGQFERSHPLVASLGMALGMTDEQVDEIFRQAATL